MKLYLINKMVTKLKNTYPLSTFLEDQKKAIIFISENNILFHVSENE